ncbi:DUF1559 domain-containing protein [Pirellulaceae bacterium]|nr:DUF1559 domain-containing protein [Pirellulaceae bacterium]
MNRGIGKSELLAFVVLAIVCAGLLWPYIFGRRMDSRVNMCDFRLAELGFAVQHAEANARRIPNYRNLWQPSQLIEEQGVKSNRIVGWPLLALPALGLQPQNEMDGYSIESDNRQGEYKELFNSFALDYAESAQSQLRNTYLPQLVCPDNPPIELEQGRPLPGGYISFVANGGLPDAPKAPAAAVLVDYPANGLFTDDPHLSGDQIGWNEYTFRSVSEKDGLDHTLMLSENIDSGNWIDGKPSGLLFHWRPVEPIPEGVHVIAVFALNEQRGAGRGKDDMRFARISSNHHGIANAVYASGRTDRLHESINPRVLQLLMMSSDQEGVWPGTNTPISSTQKPSNPMQSKPTD